MNRRQLLKRIGGTAAAVAVPIPLLAQSDNAITIVVPYAAGGTTDMLGRMLAKEMAPLLGRTIIVDNKPGAGSGVGASFVARAPADGNTLLVATSSTLAINPWLYKKLNYDPLKDFTPVGMIGAVPLVVVVNASVPVNSIGELIALSKAKPGSLSYGSAGNGSPQHLVAEMFKAATGAQLTHIPYRGSGPAVTDLLGGQIHVMFSDIPPALQHVRAGRLRALAVTSARRQPTLLDVPTIAESGQRGTADFQGIAWQSLVAPAGTPAEIVSKYADALAKVMNQRELRARLAADGFEPGSMMPKQLEAYIRTETERWGKTIKASGATID
jgi:tripartite-type tricarboxylate transporter receptor subunit TctC